MPTLPLLASGSGAPPAPVAFEVLQRTEERLRLAGPAAASWHQAGATDERNRLGGPDDPGWVA